jgi:hypothetical protein
MKLTNFTRRSRRSRGAGIVEFLVVAPLLILLGLGLVQTGMVFHSKSSLNFALQEGARIGSVRNGDVAEIARGVREGLIPFMGGGRSDAEITETRGRVLAEFMLGSNAGWIRMNQLSPTQQSFDDWAENSFDEQGNAVREIPNASLAVLRCTKTPAGGAAGTRASTACPGGGEPIGRSSQQTLADANLLKLNMTYGVKLSVPVVNRMVAGVLSMAAGCRANEEQRIGTLNLGAAEVVNAQPANCAYYNAVDAEGRPSPRIPVNLSVTVRMQSPARFAGNAGWFARVNRNRDANTAGQQLGNGEVLAAAQFEPVPVSQLNPNGVTYANDTVARLSGDGSLNFGANTDWSARPATPPGSGTGPGGILPPPECTGEVAPEADNEGSTGILGTIWNSITGMVATAYDFVRGFWEGFKQQIGDLINAVMNPVETAEGLYNLAMAFYDDPEGTIEMIAQALGRDLSTLVSCGAYDRGRILGNYVSPAFMLKVASKLARFGRAGLRRAIDDTKRELGCASFGAGTVVLLDPNTLASIESLKRGDAVSSRSADSYLDATQDITHTFNRTAQFYYRLKTGSEEFKVTDEHPFWVQGRGWTKVSEIRRGDAIATANGDTVVLENVRVDEPLQVFNFSVASTESYFVGNEGMWVHNSSCVIRRPYHAPASPSGHAVGASDGGPGQWREIGRPQNARYAYQQAVTGTPRRPPAPGRTATQLPEYRVGNADFDGFDAQRGVLIDAKHLTDACPLGPNSTCPARIADNIRAGWAREATRQLDATRGSNTPIEWIVSNEQMSVYVSELINNLPAADRHRITVIVVLAEDIVP